MSTPFFVLARSWKIGSLCLDHLGISHFRADPFKVKDTEIRLLEFEKFDFEGLEIVRSASPD